MWRTVYLSKLPGLDKKVRVAFDWTLDLLFPKDVCAVHDLDQRRDFRWRDHAENTSGNNGDHELGPREAVQLNMGDRLTGSKPTGSETGL